MWVVPVEGKAVGEPGVDVVQAHLLAWRVGQSLKSVDYQVILKFLHGYIVISGDLVSGDLLYQSCVCEGRPHIFVL